MENTYVTIIPAFRISTGTHPDVRVYCGLESLLTVNVIKNDEIVNSFKYVISEVGVE